MKLFTSAIDKELFSQYSKGNDLSSQKVVAKIFNPFGRGTWYLINSDPSDPDYIWAIVELFEVEVGSVSRSELENIKVPPFRLPLERDLSFTPINAEELLNGLMQGNRYAKGGVTKYQNDIEVIEASDGSNFLFPESNDPKNVGILLANGGYMKKGGITGDLHSLTDELLAQKIKIFIDKIKPIKYYYIDEDSNSLIIGLDENYTQDLADKLYKEATSSMEFFDADSVDMHYIPHKKQTEYSIKLKKVAKFAKGGEMEEGVDLFEDYENIPAKVQKVLDENSVAFEDGDYRDLEKAVKELEKIGYTFEYGLDGQAYDLRKIGQKGKSELDNDEYADGGEVGGVTADEAIYLYIKKAINQPYREKYLKPAGLWNTPKMKEVEQSLKKKGYLNGAGAINETGKNKAREVDASIDMIISRRYISSTNTKSVYLEILEKFQGNDKMAKGGYMAKGGEVGVRYFIGKPEVDKVGRFGKKRASWKTCLVNENGEKNYSEYTTSFVGSLSDVKLDGIKISQSEFDKLNFDKKMAKGGYMEEGGEIVTFPKRMNEYIDQTSKKWIKEPFSIRKGELIIYNHSPRKATEAKFLGKSGDKAKIEILESYTPFTKRVDADFVSPVGRTQPANYLKQVPRGTIKTVSVDNIEIVNQEYYRAYIKPISQWLRSPEFKEAFSYLDDKMAMGGEVKFSDKVKSIKKSLLERKKVSPKVQKDYGKTYSPKEAEESAKRIVGAMRKKMMGESK